VVVLGADDQVAGAGLLAVRDLYRGSPRDQTEVREFAADAAAQLPAACLLPLANSYAQAPDELVEARNRLARAIADAATSGRTKDEIVDLTGYPADLVLRISRAAGVGEAGSAP
jgi:hypothetical protein